MKISVQAKPNSKEERVEKVLIDDQEIYRISVKEPPIQGRANAAIIKLLADYFKVPLGKVRIVSGHTSRQKIIEIF